MIGRLSFAPLSDNLVMDLDLKVEEPMFQMA